MPDTVIQPPIPTTPVTDEILARLRAIVGDKGLIVDEQDKKPFVTDWRGSLAGSAAVVVRPAYGYAYRPYGPYWRRGWR